MIDLYFLVLFSNSLYLPASASNSPSDFSGGPKTHCALLDVKPWARKTGGPGILLFL